MQKIFEIGSLIRDKYTHAEKRAWTGFWNVFYLYTM